MSIGFPKPPRSGPKPKQAPRRTNTRRANQNWTRAYGSHERAQWVSEQPCIVDRWCLGRIENAHTKGDGGGSRKSSARFIVPACTKHHHEMHDGIETFAAKYGVDLEQLAAATESAWRAHQGET